MAKPDDIAFNAMKDGGKKMDLFGESFWYSDTTHIKEPYITFSEVKREVSPEYLNQKKDAIMPLYAKSHGGVQKTEIGKVAVNPKNIVYGTEKDGSLMDPKGAKIWGDILDEDGNKTGKQILLEPALNVLKEGKGNLYNYLNREGRGSISGEDKTFGLVIQEIMEEYGGSEFWRKEGSEIGYNPAAEGVGRYKVPYIYKDEDGTQYSSSQAPYGENK